MKLPLPVDFFAPVRLSPQETQELHLVETRLLDSYLASYEQYAAAQTQPHAHGSASDAPSSAVSWKLMGQRDGVKIFSKRQAKPKKNKSKPACNQPRRRRQRQHPAPTALDSDEHARLPGVRVVGSVDGALEEVMYGSMWRSGRERRGRAQLTGDGVADAAVLCRVETPTPGDPYRSLAVKWALKRGSLGVKDRDVCYLAASGLIRSPRTGRQLGFRLRHSVSFPSCPPFQNRSVVRAQLYLCSFFRQLRHGRVEVFHQASFDAGGGRGLGLGLPRVMAERAAADCLVSLADVRAVSLAKKLARAVQNGEAERAEASLSQMSVQESLDGERRCGMCLRRLGTALKRRCAVCRHWTCAQCSVRHEIMPARAPVTARCFCKACVAKVLRDDARLYAVGDAHEHPHEAAQQPGSGRWGHDDIGGVEDEESDEEVALGLPDELASGRRHSLVLFASGVSNFDADTLAPTSRQRRSMTAGGLRTPPARMSAKQLSGNSEAVNTVDSSPPDSRRRSATVANVSMATTTATATEMRSQVRRRRLSIHAPDILLRSDVGQRNWASSTSALSLQSPQRTVGGSPVVRVARSRSRSRSRGRGRSPSVSRLSFGSSCSSSSSKSGEVRVRICTPKHPRSAAPLPYFASAPATAPREQQPSRQRQAFRAPL